MNSYRSQNRIIARSDRIQTEYLEKPSGYQGDPGYFSEHQLENFRIRPKVPEDGWGLRRDIRYAAVACADCDRENPFTVAIPVLGYLPTAAVSDARGAWEYALQHTPDLRKHAAVKTVYEALKIARGRERRAGAAHA